MGVNVAGASVAAFGALIGAVLLIGIAVVARRKGHLTSRPPSYALAAVIFVLVAYGMTGGFFPNS